MRPDERVYQQTAVVGVVAAKCAVGPVGDEERLAVGVEENAVRAAAGLEMLDDHSRLRIDDGNLVVIEVGGVNETAVGGDRDVADEVAIGWLGGDGEGSGGL